MTPDSAGGGAAVPFALYRSLNPTATRNVLFADFGRWCEGSCRSASCEPRTSRRRTHCPCRRASRLCDASFPAPVVLALVLSVLLLVGCAFLLTLSVRAQRRDFAILRALGARRRQLRAVVHWEATLVVLAILVVGVPVGVALGRLIVRELTGRLGIVPGIDSRCWRCSPGAWSRSWWPTCSRSSPPAVPPLAPGGAARRAIRPAS